MFGPSCGISGTELPTIAFNLGYKYYFYYSLEIMQYTNSINKALLLIKKAI